MKVEENFGFLSRFSFLQDLGSFFIAKLNPAVIHNLAKYMALKKVHYLSAIEEIDGDYLEFGVYKGSSFCHSLRCLRQLVRINNHVESTISYGFDSFEGFGEFKQEDKHPFYEKINFEASYEKVDSRAKKAAKQLKYKLIKGFFDETLSVKPDSYGIKKARIIFIDSDTYSSSVQAFRFVLPIIQKGSYVILDDYFSYKGDESKGVAKAFKEFREEGKLLARHVFSYGMGGVVFIIS